MAVVLDCLRHVATCSRGGSQRSRLGVDLLEKSVHRLGGNGGTAGVGWVGVGAAAAIAIVAAAARAAALVGVGEPPYERSDEMDEPPSREDPSSWPSSDLPDDEPLTLDVTLGLRMVTLRRMRRLVLRLLAVSLLSSPLSFPASPSPPPVVMVTVLPPRRSSPSPPSTSRALVEATSARAVRAAEDESLLDESLCVVDDSSEPEVSLPPPPASAATCCSEATLSCPCWLDMETKWLRGVHSGSDGWMEAFCVACSEVGRPEQFQIALGMENREEPCATIFVGWESRWDGEGYDNASSMVASI